VNRCSLAEKDPLLAFLKPDGRFSLGYVNPRDPGEAVFDVDFALEPFQQFLMPV
jgi:hypothetical protein